MRYADNNPCISAHCSQMLLFVSEQITKCSYLKGSAIVAGGKEIQLCIQMKRKKIFLFT